MTSANTVEKKYAEEMRKIDRFMLVLILAHLPIAAFVVPYGYGTMVLGAAGAALTGALALAGFFLLRDHALRLLNGLLLMFLSFLFISCQLGRIEMHFHIFGALAFLIMYRDWKIFPSLTVFIALHHGVLNYCQQIELQIGGLPLKAFSYGDGWDIVLLHAAFVVFEASVLIYMSAQLKKQFVEQESRNNELEELRRTGNREIVSEVKNTSGLFTNSSSNLLGMASDLSDRAGVQASSIEEISATMEEMAASLDNIFATTSRQTDGVRSLADKMKDLRRVNDSVSSDVQQTVRSVRATSDIARSGETSLRTLNASMSEIVASAEKMRGIVSIIHDIADKVNLLSLNASIEAARAGEAGRGFTVVAEEIAKLADQTGHSIKDINALIGTSTKQAENGMRDMEASSAVLQKIIADVDQINRLSESISNSLQVQDRHQADVATSIDEMDQSSGFIKSSTQEQKQAIRQILGTLESLTKATESYASSATRLTEIARANDSATKNFAEKVTALAAT